MEPRLSASRIEPIETLRVGYRHRRAFTVEATGSGDAICYMWVYAEALTIDRETQTVSLQRQWNENVDTTTQYHIAGGVSPLLDECTGYFLDWEAKETDADAPRDCEIDILYQSGARRTWRVSYERAALPEGWEDFLDDVRTLIAPTAKANCSILCCAHAACARASTSIAASPSSPMKKHTTIAQMTIPCAPETG